MFKQAIFPKSGGSKGRQVQAILVNQKDLLIPAKDSDDRLNPWKIFIHLEYQRRRALFL